MIIMSEMWHIVLCVVWAHWEPLEPAHTSLMTVVYMNVDEYGYDHLKNIFVEYPTLCISAASNRLKLQQEYIYSNLCVRVSTNINILKLNISKTKPIFPHFVPHIFSLDSLKIIIKLFRILKKIQIITKYLEISDYSIVAKLSKCLR